MGKESVFWEVLKNPDTLSFAFWLSVGLLLLVSLLKYFVSKECDMKDWGNLLLEFPIDVCLVVITIILSGFMKGNNLGIGIVLVVISLIVSVVCCMLRRFSIKCSYEENKKVKTVTFAILDVILAVGWISFVYSKIC